MRGEREKRKKHFLTEKEMVAKGEKKREREGKKQREDEGEREGGRKRCPG